MHDLLPTPRKARGVAPQPVGADLTRDDRASSHEAQCTGGEYKEGDDDFDEREAVSEGSSHDAIIL